jgi:hypothetical protein
MAHKKAGGSTRNGRDSHSKRLGVKAFGGEHVQVTFKRKGAAQQMYVSVVQPIVAKTAESGG